MRKLIRLREKSIEDFGSQWSIHGDLPEGHWTSDAMFRDHWGSSFDPNQITGKRVAEVGSGSGRVLRMISRYDPECIFGIEPSNGINLLHLKLPDFKGKLRLIHARADEFKIEECDFLFCFGVLHHIPEPKKALRNMAKALKPDGKLLVWVYGYEGNQIYVLLQSLLRPLLRLLPDKVLELFAILARELVILYFQIGSLVLKRGFPLQSYLKSVFMECDRQSQKFIIFDQINPIYSKYYRKEEIIALVEECNFDVEDIHHRHGYSWFLICKVKDNV